MINITSRTNDSVKYLCRLAEDASLRRSRGLCIIEGAKLCFDLRDRVVFKQLWVTDAAYAASKTKIDGFASSDNCDVILTNDNVYEKISYFRSGDGILGVAEIPKRDLPEKGEPLAVLCDIQDPGNVGGLIRSAAALGFGGAVLCGSCADPFSPRAVRGSMGSSMLFPCIHADDPAFLCEKGYSLVATALDPDAVSVKDIPKDRPVALLIGNEGHGLTENLLSMADVTVYIPITSDAESLNAAAAAAIAMWEVVR